MRLSRGFVPLLFALLMLVPSTAWAHDENGQPLPGEEEELERGPEEAPPNTGYTGPTDLPYLSFFRGVWVYGQVREDLLFNQMPRSVRGEGDWLVWEDARRSDIFLYSVSAADGFYLTDDRAAQRNPSISGSLIVWEDYRDGPARIYAYDIATAETRRVSSGPGNHRNPSLDGTLVAWEDDRARNQDVYAYSFANDTVFPVAATEERESDPLVLDGAVYYRSYRFNVWDVFAYSTETNRTVALTSDSQIQGAPFTNGREVLFLTQDFGSWLVQRYDPATDRVRSTTVRTADMSRTPASGDHLLQLARDVGYAQVIARNLTSGSTNHITGNLALVTEPHLDGKNAYLMVMTEQGVSLVVVEVSDFAFSKRPSLIVNAPLAGTPWIRPLTAQGVLRAGTTWVEPDTFTYRINGGAPQAVLPAQSWQFVLDPAGLAPGAYEVEIRATFREGPPVTATVQLNVPSTGTGINLEEAAADFHRARLYAAYNRYVGENAAAWVILPLVLVLIALVVFRLVLAYRARRRGIVVEYVRP